DRQSGRVRRLVPFVADTNLAAPGADIVVRRVTGLHVGFDLRMNARFVEPVLPQLHGVSIIHLERAAISSSATPQSRVLLLDLASEIKPTAAEQDYHDNDDEKSIRVHWAFPPSACFYTEP